MSSKLRNSAGAFLLLSSSPLIVALEDKTNKVSRLATSTVGQEPVGQESIAGRDHDSASLRDGEVCEPEPISCYTVQPYDYCYIDRRRDASSLQPVTKFLRNCRHHRVVIEMTAPRVSMTCVLIMWTFQSPFCNEIPHSFDVYYRIVCVIRPLLYEIINRTTRRQDVTITQDVRINRRKPMNAACRRTDKLLPTWEDSS